jgi:hypothetical protein
MGAGLSTSCGETFSSRPESRAGAGASAAGTANGGGGSAGDGGRSSVGGNSTHPNGAGAAGEAGATPGDGGADAGGASGSAGAGGEAATPAPPCNWEAPVDGCTATEKDGIFVAPKGDDAADGTPEQPLASIREGVARARAMVKPRPVFVCAASFDEHVEIRHDGIRLQGGFVCPKAPAEHWVYTEGARPRLAPSTHGYALRVRDADRVAVSDFELHAVAGVMLGDSSIAVFASNTIDLAFDRVLVRTGDGAKGEPGVLTPHAFPDLPPPNPRSEDTGAAPLSCACPGSKVLTVGGGGGNGGDPPTNGAPGQPLYSAGGAGGIAGAECLRGGGRGQPGGNAPPAAPGPGARGLGTVTASGWERSTADAGPTGSPGQGGGGGSGELPISKGAHGGSSGHCGGCGGKGGGGGRAGGASIGVLSYLSSVTLRDSEIRTGRGGNGGGGASGQEGSLGGQATSNTCTAGGSGGMGGTGGMGGGGAGGISVGVVWSGGTEPALDETGVFTGEPGPPGGLEGENRGIPGVSLTLLATR